MVRPYTIQAMTLGFTPLPSAREQLAQFRATHASGAQPTTPDDAQSMGAHLMDGLLFDLTHTLVHARRLGEPEVQSDPEAVAFNVDHAQHHAAEAATSALKLKDWLMEHPSDPQDFAAAFEQLSEQLPAA
jgi:hypothetical protein